MSLIEVQAELVDVLNFGTAESPRFTAEVPKPTPLSPNGTGTLSPVVTDPNKGRPIYYLMHASPQAAPHREPVVVRSKHDTSAVWRVLPHEADAAADRGPVVRAVARIEVK